MHKIFLKLAIPNSSYGLSKLAAKMFLQFGINAEHSWADAPIVGYLLEYGCNIEHKIGYHDNGSCRGRVDAIPSKPQRLEWDIPEEVHIQS